MGGGGVDCSWWGMAGLTAVGGGWRVDMQLVGDGGLTCSWWGMVGLTAVGGGWLD